MKSRAIELLATLKQRDIRLWLEDGQLRYDAPKGALTPELRDRVVAAKAELIELLSRARGAPAPPLERLPRDGRLPLSCGQERLWFLAQLEPESLAYNVPATVRLRGELDRGALARGIAEVARRHETLRSRFPSADGEPHAVIAASVPIDLEPRGLGELPAEERLPEALRLARAEASRPFDVARGPLFRTALYALGEGDHLLQITWHHLVADGWGIGAFFKELHALYEAFAAGRPSPLTELAVQYVDFAHWQRRCLEGPALADDLEYWRRQLGGDRPITELPVDRPRPAVPSHRGAACDFAVPGSLLPRLGDLARRFDATPFMVLLSAFLVLLGRLTGQRDLIVGTPISGRSRSELEGLIGFFVNNLVLRGDLGGDPGFRELLARVRRMVLDAFARPEVPFERLVEELDPERDASRNPLFQVLFNHFNMASVYENKLGALAFEPIGRPLATSKFDLTLHCYEVEGRLVARVEHSTDLFDATTVDRLGRAYLRLLRAIVEDPERPISRLATLGAAQRHQLLAEWSPRPPAAGRTVPELFAARAAQSPAAVALVFEDRRLTWGELEGDSALLARTLRARGVGPETRVALVLERSAEMVVALLAVLRAGGAYVPLAADQPAERLAFLLEDSRATLVLTHEALARQLPRGGAPHLCLDGDWRAAATELPAAALPAVGGGQLAYVVYTSGSTGRPKGVLIEHRQLASYTQGLLARLELPPGTRYATVSTLAADLGNTSIFAALCGGGELHVMSEERIGDGDRFAEAVAGAAVDCLKIVPSHLEALLAAAAEPARVLPRRLLVLGGEAASGELIGRIARLAPGCAVLNHYGPTETTVGVLAHRVEAGDAGRFAAAPIGRPMDHARAHVLGRGGEPLPVGAVGELCIGGASVARGYLGRPGLTAERFLPDPWAGQPGARLYRTGDLARHTADGRVLFLGRGDDQVKIRGFRVEPGEVAAVLNRHPALDAAAVVVHRSAVGVVRLVAYVAGREAPPASELRGFLRRELPEHMVPAAFIALERLPLTANGKLDKRALPPPELDGRRSGEGYVAPSTAAERTLAAIWADVLRVERVGVHDDYFELGGESILSIRIVSRAGRAGLGLTPRDVFLHPTIAELARVAGTAAVAVAAEQGPVTGPIPLTPIQHRFFAHRVADPHHYNHALMLTLREPLSDRVLAAAVAALLDHHDILRARFHHRGGRWLQEAGEPGGAPPFVTIELGGMPPEQRRRALADHAAKLQGSLDLAAGPLVRVTRFATAGEDDRLLVAVHHLAVDGVSWQILLEDLATACGQLRRGAPPELPAKTTSYRAWAERLAEAARGEAFAAEAGWWERDAHRAAARLPVDRPGGENTAAVVRAVEVELDEAETRALLREVPKAYRSRIDEVLLCALARALAPLCGSSPLLVDLEGHGREDVFEGIDLSRTVGWFTAVYPVVLDFAQSEWPGGALKAVKETLRQVPDRGLGWGLLRFLGGGEAARLGELSAAEIGFNYLGHFDRPVEDSPLFAAAPETSGPGSSPRNRRRYLLDVLGSVRGGRLGMSFLYSRELHEHATVEALGERFLAALRQLVAHCTAPGAGGWTPSDFPHARLDQVALDRLAERYREAGIEDVYVLSPLQQGMLYHSLASPPGEGEGEGDVYVTQMSCVLAPGASGAVDPAAWRRAWQRAIDRQPMLRTAFVLDASSELHQVVCRRLEVPWRELDWRGAAPEEQRQRTDDLKIGERRAFDLAEPPLLRLVLARLDESRYQLVWTHHHALLDGWSLPLLMREVFGLYADEHAGRAAEAAPARPGAARPFVDYVAWLGRQDKAAAERYWRRALDGLGLPTPLPAARPGGGAAGSPAVLHDALLTRQETVRLEAMVRQHGLTLNTVVLGAWSLLLSRYSGAREVVVGVTLAGRPAELAGVEEMVGSFINTLPLRVGVGSGPAVPWLRRLQAQQAELRQYEYSPLFEVQALAGRAGRPLFENLFVFESYPVEAAQVATGVLAIEEPESATRANYPLALVVQPGRRLLLQLRYDPARCGRQGMVGVLERLRSVLGTLVESPESGLAGLWGLSSGERHQLLVEWNDTRYGFVERAVHKLVAARAVRQGKALAVAEAGRELSYGELDLRANQLAHALRRQGVGPEVRVGIGTEQGPDMVVAKLAVLKASGAYVPLDPDLPRERLAFMLEDARISVVLVDRSWPAELSELSPRVVQVDADNFADERREAPPTAIHPESLAYVIYTSGSTGRPKGVEVTHTGLLNLVHWHRRTYSVTPADRATQVAAMGFDACVWELWPYLTAGSSIHFPPPSARSVPAELWAWLAAREITLSFLPTPLAEAALREPLPGGLVLRALLTGGDRLRFAVEKPLPFALVNHYGPTENTVVATWEPVDAAALPPIGRPITNTTAYLLDRSLAPVAPRVAGELHLGGKSLARGYLAKPGLTAERFLPDPFGGEPGARLYKTGDLGRHLPDGRIDFLGRNDHQVKLRGFRIELGEVEAVLLRHPGVRESVVVVDAQKDGDKKLLAYVAGDGLAPADLRQHLRRSLPEHMVPSAFIVLDALPLTTNGKVDRAALPAQRAERQAVREYVAPRSELEERIAAIWREVLELPAVGMRDNFFDLGGHSLRLLRMRTRLAEELGAELAVAELFAHSTVESLARHLTEGAAGEPGHAPAARPAAGAVSTAEGTDGGAIAVIAMAGRFPGAPDVEAFWDNLEGGVEGIRRFSDDELRAAGVSESLLADPRYVKARGVIDDVDLFDAHYFGYSPREAELIDPQQRLFLECAVEALERAGVDPQRFSGAIGVWAGTTQSGYLENLRSRPELLASVGWMEAQMGTTREMLPTRVSYLLNLRGPSVNVQTACSTSLVAVHEACRGLLDRECDLALAGGISIPVPVVTGYPYQEGGIRSADGRCRSFDADAGGTVSGSGLGIVVLKRLAEAAADGDRIHAVIRGTAINNDGARKVGFTAPSVEGQVEVIARAQAAAGVAPETIGYVEAHGTGTALGDPIEMAALNRAFGEAGGRATCALGSVKSNIGHLNDAAGVAGLIKAVLALEHRRLPPSLHFRRPNPEIDFDAGPFYVNTEHRPWETGGAPRRAAVSSFGIGGTNAHAVLEEAPPREPSGPSRQWQLLVLSARTRAALDQASQDLAGHLEGDPETPLADVAHTLQVGRRQHEHRRAVLCRDAEGAVAALGGSRPKARWTRHVPAGERRVVFMLPGQGAQYVGMARGLYTREAAFRDAFDRCAEGFAAAGNAETAAETDLDLRALLYPEGGASEAASEQLRRTSVAQPALFAVEYALAQLWRSWGIEPQALIGHSIGEVVAACLSGVLELADALRLVALRGRLMEAMPAGAMLGVPLAEQRLRGLLDGEEGLWLAAVNAPELCAVAGTPERVEAFARRLAEEGISGRRLHTSHAFHSGLMEGAVTPFVEAVRGIALGAPRIPYLSNVSGDWITEQEATDPEYWGRHLRRTVRFSDGLAKLLGDAGRVLLEVGPGRVLSSLVKEQPEGVGRVAVTSLRHPQAEEPDEAFLAGALGQLWTAGVEVDWERFYAGERRCRVTLPTYPFEHRRYWIEARPRSEVAAPQRPRRAPADDWFYVPSWRRSLPSPPATATAEAGTRCLVFGDGSSFARRVVEGLAAAGRRVVVVLPGAAFGATASGWEVDPGRAGDYRRLLAALAADGGPPGEVVHLWTAAGGERPAGEAAETCLDRAFYSLFHFAHALADSGTTAPVALTVVSAGAFEVVGGELLEPERTTVTGPCRVMGLELPNVSCRHLDLSLAELAADGGALAELAVRELAAAGGEPLVAWRGGRRWVEDFAPVRLTEEAPHPSRLRPGGTYLITGGLGGIGLALARYLASAVSANLVLVGRSPLPPRQSWADLLAEEGGDERLRHKVRAVQELEEAGAEVLAAAADVADREGMRQVLGEARRRFGRIDGVIHAAGVPGEGLILTKQPQQAARVLAPKVAGTRVLAELFGDAELSFLVLCSSLNAVKGSPGQVDYCAANAYLDAFARRFRADTGTFTVSINWNRWRESGMAFEALGGGTLDEHLGISDREGAAAFARVLARCDEPQVLISELDLEAVLAGATAAPADAAESSDGAVPPPSGQLEAHPRPELSSELVAPRSDVERALAEIWQQLLGIEGLGVHDDFFELGGHSLKATQMISRVREELGVELPVKASFESPTIAELAERLETLRWVEQGTAAQGIGTQETVAAAAGEREELEL